MRAPRLVVMCCAALVGAMASCASGRISVDVVDAAAEPPTSEAPDDLVAAVRGAARDSKEFFRCYGQALHKAPQPFVAKALLRFRVQASTGAFASEAVVVATDQASHNAHNDGLSDCLRRKLEALRVPPTAKASGAAYRFQYALRFSHGDVQAAKWRLEDASYCHSAPSVAAAVACLAEHKPALGACFEGHRGATTGLSTKLHLFVDPSGKVVRVQPERAQLPTACLNRQMVGMALPLPRAATVRKHTLTLRVSTTSASDASASQGLLRVAESDIHVRTEVEVRPADLPKEGILDSY